MWTYIEAARFVLGRSFRAILAVAAFAMMTPTPSDAAPVEYVRVCSLYGAGFFYIPGTDTCTDTNQIVANQFAVAQLMTLAATGTAMTAALVNPFLPDKTNFAISTHWAIFDGQNAVGVAGLMRLWGNLALSAGVAVGFDHGSLLSTSDRTQTALGTSLPSQSWSDVRVLGRVGLQYSW
jgi:hypothetical protein